MSKTIFFTTDAEKDTAVAEKQAEISKAEVELADLQGATVGEVPTTPGQDTESDTAAE